MTVKLYLPYILTFTAFLACSQTSLAMPQQEDEQSKPFSQQRAEMDALAGYEVIHPPLDTIPMPALAENQASFGAHLVRSASLLETSSKDRHNPVKVLIYGQSIVGSVLFTEEVRSYLKTKFPYAEIQLENKAIGGFTADHLVRTAVHDLYPTDADLIIFHVYGGERTGELEQIFSKLRRSTTADILLMNHHLNASQKKSDENQAKYLRYIASRYDLELADIASEWPAYLEQNKLKPSDLLRDGVHPNRNGNWLLAQLVCRHIRYNGSSRSGWYQNIRLYDAASALDQDQANPITLLGSGWQLNQTAVQNDNKQSSLKFSFTGNRVDINWGHPQKLSSPGSVKILLDGKSINETNMSYTITRPSAGAGTWWPAIRQIGHVRPLVQEDWTLKIYEISADSSTFKYKVSGSKTGDDGAGISTAPFISKSGRVCIQPDDFMFTRIRKTFKTATPDGFEVKWAVIPRFQSVYPCPTVTDNSHFYKTILVQGISNSAHTLEIIPLGNGPVSIASLEVYEPDLK